MVRFVLKDELLDGQALRAAGSAPYGGADVGECIAAARAVDETDLGSWYDAWAAMADRARALATRELAAGRTESARAASFRASSYDRTAGLMLMGVPLDGRLVGSNRRQTDAFRQGAALLPHPPDVVEIPYEGTTLPGYFFRCSDDAAPRRTLITLGGYDSTAEEGYFFNGAAALARGYHVLAFDGPGQGSALIQQGLVLRADWGAVMTPVLDWLLARPEVDPEQVVLVGASLGAHLAPRAAATEHRFAAVVADCGAYDLHAGMVERIPGPLREGVDDPDGRRGRLLATLLARVAARPTGGWALRRGVLVHGVPDPLSYARSLEDYTLAGSAEQIACPVLVCNAEGDDISASAPQLVAALRTPTQLVTFTAADGADNHCESGARLLFHARAFGWLEDVLAR